MQGIVNKAICLSLLIALLSESSTGLFSRRRRKCRKAFWRISSRRRCRRPSIPMVQGTMKPKTLPPTKPTEPVVRFNPVVLHPSGLPYCKARDLTAVLRPRNRRTKRAAQTWPYECRHASIVVHSGQPQFIWPIYDCCLKCDFPAFTKCVANSNNAPEWKCPSEGFHCIVGCVNSNNPAGARGGIIILANKVRPQVTIPGKPALKVKPKLVLNSCEKEENENGKKCVRKLCIPLNL